MSVPFFAQIRNIEGKEVEQVKWWGHLLHENNEYALIWPFNYSL